MVDKLDQPVNFSCQVHDVFCLVFHGSRFSFFLLFLDYLTICFFKWSHYNTFGPIWLGEFKLTCFLELKIVKVIVTSHIE